jgi:hypothetical protein
MLTRNTTSAGIAGIVAFICYLTSGTLLGGASLAADFLPTLLCGVGTFIVALVVTSVISSNLKNQRK